MEGRPGGEDTLQNVRNPFVNMFSEVDLDGASPVRVRPGVGEWGPVNVPSTAQKKRMRIWVVLAFIASACLVCFLGYQFYQAIMGGA